MWWNSDPWAAINFNWGVPARTHTNSINANKSPRLWCPWGIEIFQLPDYTWLSWWKRKCWLKCPLHTDLPESGVYCETHCNGTQLIIKKRFEFIPQMSMSSESCLKWTTQGHNICSQQFYRNVHYLLMTFCNVGENKSFSLQEADMQFVRGRDTTVN